MTSGAVDRFEHWCSRSREPVAHAASADQHGRSRFSPPRVHAIWDTRAIGYELVPEVA